MKQIPNLFTLMNLCMGCIAIVFILQPGEILMNVQGAEWKAIMPEKIVWASVCLGIASVIDFLDGFVARLFKATSEMGKQLDSLADVVSFGVAPGLILYQLLRIGFAANVGGLETPLLWILPAMLFPLAAAWRLARFNLEKHQHEHFEGLPTPAAGLVVASLPLLLLYNPFGIHELVINTWILYGICIIVPYLMISKLALISLKFKSFGFPENKARYTLLAIAVLMIIFLGWLSVPAIFVAYILVSLLFKNQHP